MSAHTPGPWEAMIFGGWDAPRIWSGDGSIALLQHHDSGPEEAEANALLIAAAPELLEALTLLVAGIENSVSKTYIPLVRANAAIAKAIGERHD